MNARIQTLPARSSPAPSTREALGGLGLAMLLSSLGTSVANVALPTLARELGASFQEVQGVVVSYQLGVTAAIVGAGRLGDRYGRRRVLVGGLLLFVGAAAMSGLAPSLGLLLLARLAQGVGAAVLMSLTLAFVADLSPKGRTGSAMGLLGTTSAIGTALGPSIGGALTSQLGWRAIFLVQVPLGLLALLLACRSLPAGDPVEAPRAGSPWLPLDLLRDRALGASLAMSMLAATVLMATLVVGPFYLSRGLGLATGSVGLVMAAGPLAAALTGVPAGRLVDQLGARRATLAGLVGMAAGAAILALTPERLGAPAYIAPIVLLTSGYALFQAANNTGVVGALSPDRRGLVSGLLTLSRNLGLLTGAALMGAVFAAASGHADIAQAPAGDVAAGMRATFAFAAALVTLALGLGHLGRRPGVLYSPDARAALEPAPLLLGRWLGQERAPR